MIRELHWALYYGMGWTWLPKPPLKPWRILLLPGMEPPPPVAGYEQRIVRLPTGDKSE